MELAIFIVCLGLLFDYTNGFHDAANVVSTVIATRVLAPLTAIILAGILNALGATHTSGVAETISTGLIDSAAASQLMILCALLGAIAWNFLTWYFGMPSSSTYALVGGLVGAALFGKGSGVVLWGGVINKVIIPMVLSPIAGFILAYIVMKLLRRYAKSEKSKLFSHLQIGSASIVALSHGLNDAQKSMGIITLGLFAANLLPSPAIPIWVILSCALVMGLGTAMGGWRIIRTVGFEITKISPVQGFAAETTASCVILVASFLGMPVSSTHMIVGSVTGVGAAKGARAVKWLTAKKLTIAWVLTLPGAALLSGAFYFLANLFLS